MNRWLLRLSSLFSLVLLLNARAAEVQLSRQGTSTLLRVEGDPDNDWLIQLSTNLATWNNIPGLHASFKLSASGEQLFLTDTDANLNAILDTVTFTSLETDRSYGRTSADADVWSVQTPTPAAPNP